MKRIALLLVLVAPQLAAASGSMTAQDIQNKISGYSAKCQKGDDKACKKVAKYKKWLKLRAQCVDQNDNAACAQYFYEAQHHPRPVNWFQANPFAYKGKDAYGRTEEDPNYDPSQPMSPAFFWMLVNFFVVVAILRWKAVPIFRRSARKRHVETKDALEEAAQKKAQAQQELASFDAKLKGVEDEVDEIVSGIRASAEAEKKRIMAEAEQQAEATRKAAENQAAAELQAAANAIRAEVVDAAVEKAEAKLRAEASANPAALIDNFIAALEAQAQEAR